MANSRILDESKLNTETVQVLNKVKIKNLANGMAVEYTIVADSEANLKEKENRGQHTHRQRSLGHKVGDVVEIKGAIGPDEV